MKKAINIIAALGILGAGYVGGVNHFTYYTYPNTTYNENNYGSMTRDKIKNKLDQNEMRNVVLTEGGENIEIPGDAVGLKMSFDESSILKDNNKLAWPLEIFKEHKLDSTPYKVSYDSEKLKAEVSKLDIVKNTSNRIKSVNASVVKGDGAYRISSGVLGTEIDENKLVSMLKDSLDKGEEKFDLSSKKPYKEPEIGPDSEVLKTQLANLNTWANTNITVDVNGNKEVIANWENKYGLKTNKEEGFAEYNNEVFKKIADDIAQKYNTVDKNREFASSTGKEVTLDPGTFGLKVNKSALIEELNNKVAVGQTNEIKVELNGVSYGDGKNDIGSSYIEVDLSTQHLWLYKDGQKVIDTPIVSGKPSDDRITPTGVYYIMWKQLDATLVGETYSQPVDYWMPFTDEGHGLHDAGWIGEDSFGGATLVERGSHGCINLPPDLAPEIYAQIDSGTPVVLYYSNGMPDYASMAVNQ